MISGTSQHRIHPSQELVHQAFPRDAEDAVYNKNYMIQAKQVNTTGSPALLYDATYCYHNGWLGSPGDPSGSGHVELVKGNIGNNDTYIIYIYIFCTLSQASIDKYSIVL